MGRPKGSKNKGKVAVKKKKTAATKKPAPVVEKDPTRMEEPFYCPACKSENIVPFTKGYDGLAYRCLRCIDPETGYYVIFIPNPEPGKRYEFKRDPR